jgi:prepilin signal peptidase PulO-like enzyme (type II secretory pathway)
MQYPIVELVTGLAFALVGFRILGTLDFSFIHIVQFLLYADVAAILIALSVYDIYHFIIPNIFIWLLFAVFVILLVVPGLFPSMSILTVFSGPIVAFPFLLIWLFSGGRLIGFGDIKLALVMGWILGVSGGIAMLMLSVWIGAIIGILFVLITRQKTLKVKIPFGPFLAIGGMLSLLYNIDVGTIIQWFI